MSIREALADEAAYLLRQERANRDVLLIAAYEKTDPEHRFRLGQVEYGPIGARQWGIVCHTDRGLGLLHPPS